MKWGLLGGSFDPIHHGHLVMAARAAEALSLDRVLFIPAARSPLKSRGGLASDRDRWAMLKLALRGDPRFEPCDLELRRGGLSYTIDTVRELKRRTAARLYFILGADAAHLLPRWKSIIELRKLVTFAISARPGQTIPPGTPKRYHVGMPLLEISGSAIRNRARKGLSFRYLVPDSVERYIRRKGLYR